MQIPNVIIYVVIVTSPPCSWVVIQYITVLVTTIHILTYKNLDLDNNINHIIIATWKRHKILWWKSHVCFIFVIFISFNILFWSLGGYYELHLWINYWLIFFKLGLTEFMTNFWSFFTYYIAQIFFSWNLYNNYFIDTQFWAKCVILSWQIGLISNDIPSNDVIKESSSDIFGDLFWWKERHAIFIQFKFWNADIDNQMYSNYLHCFWY